MILYFSATGNCKYAAARLGEAETQELLSIADCTREKRFTFEDEIIGVISPTYDWGLPSIVKGFLEQASFRTKYLYFVAACGATPGAIGAMAKETVKGRGIVVDDQNRLHHRFLLDLLILAISLNFVRLASRYRLLSAA